MKNFLLLFLLSVTLYSCQSTKNLYQEETTLYLVRHAEKVGDGTRDPDLTDEGRARAERLADLLEEADVDYIFSSDYRRTRFTAAPLAERLEQKILIYNPKSYEELTAHIDSHPGSTYLVIGHSNSTPALANKLLKKEKYSQYDEKDYSNIIMVTLSEDSGRSRMLHF